jgi:hypothetical protein
MKTLYLAAFCNAALEAFGKKAHSLDDDVTGNDLRAIAKMIDIAEIHKKKIELEKTNAQYMQKLRENLREKTESSKEKIEKKDISDTSRVIG